MEIEKAPEGLESWKLKILLAGTALGALTGLGAAYLLVQRGEKTGSPPEVSPTDGIKIGLTLLGLLRQVSTLGD